jgi:putative endonuclease
VYIVRCADGTLYTGATNDLDRRVAVHNAGRGAKYTRSRLPVVLVTHVGRLTKSQALSLEWKVKHRPRAEKIAYLEETKHGNVGQDTENARREDEGGV